MREFIDILTESVGIANRKPGETFINPQGELLTFKGLVFYPSEGRYNDANDLNAQIAHLESGGTPITFVNSRTAKSLAFGVITFNDTNNNIIRVGRYFDKINPIFTGNYWSNKDLPNGFRYNRATSLKADSGLMPQDILTNQIDLSIDDIVSQVSKKFGANHALTIVAQQIAAGQPLPLEINAGDVEFTAFRDYFCELLQPMALINDLCVGNAAEAADKFFGGSFEGASISFSSGKNEGLYDSILAKGGREIKVSTKGKTGAMASVKNLIDAADELSDEMKAEFSEVIKLIKQVKKDGYADAPLNLAAQFGIISGQEADIVRSMKAGKEFRLSKNLQEIYDERAATADETKLIPYYNMLAAIAFKVADYINDETEFSKAAATILNNGALIQVYTNADNNDGVFTLRNFRAVYPSELVAGVQFSASKTYYSSGNKGNFTFKILSNDSEGTSERQKRSAAKVAAIDTKIQDIGTGTNRLDIRPPGVQNKDTYADGGHRYQKR